MAEDDLIDLLKSPKTSESEAGKSRTKPDESEAFDPKLIASLNLLHSKA